jgi:Beta-galactosidase
MVADHALRQPLAFVDQLKQRYDTIEAFNRAWGANLSGWQALLDQPFQPTGELNAAASADMRVFVKAFAGQYFRTVRDAVKKYDPNHLYLGSRFAGYTTEAVEACAEFCDMLSFNIYRPRVEHAAWSFLEYLGKPVMVGEFHMGATDRGMFHTGLVSTPDQEARAAMFTDYVHSVVDNPVFVGCHYFKYADEPLTGRPGDGENYSIGFTTVVDGLYPEMVEAAKKVSGEMYQRRSR